MVRYVTEEVDRLKEIFQGREARLTSERDRATASCQDASARCQEMEKALQDTTATLASVASDAEARLSSLFFIMRC